MLEAYKKLDIKNILKKRENFYINVSNLIIDANGLEQKKYGYKYFRKNKK